MRRQPQLPGIIIILVFASHLNCENCGTQIKEKARMGRIPFYAKYKFKLLNGNSQPASQLCSKFSSSSKKKQQHSMQQGNYKSGIYVHLLVQFYHTIFLPFTRHYSSVVDTLFSLLMVLPRLLSFETFEWKLCSARVGSLFRFAKYASFDCLPL